MCASGALDAKSALHSAAEGRSKGHADAVEALLEAGACVPCVRACAEASSLHARAAQRKVCIGADAYTSDLASGHISARRHPPMAMVPLDTAPWPRPPLQSVPADARTHARAPHSYPPSSQSLQSTFLPIAAIARSTGAAPEEGRSGLLGALTVSPLFEAVGELAEGPEGATDGAAIAAARRRSARLDERASLRAVEALLASGARPAVGVRAGWGWLLSVAPLSHAVAAKRDGATKVLLSAGADPEGGLAVPADSPDATSSSSSDFFATESEFQRMGMFGAPHGGGWLYHVTPLEAAAQAGAAACATLLLHAGADAKHGTLMFHYTPLKVGLGTPLFTAASNGHTDVGRVLLANGATMDEVPGMQYGVPPEGSVRYGSASPGGPGGSSAATAPPKAKRSKTTKKKKKATKAKTPAVEL